jgi:hypothetical protein
MPISAEDTKRLDEFLSVVKRMKESALIFSPPGYKNQIIKEVKSAFSDMKISMVDPSLQDKDEIDKIFISSLKEGSLLIVSFDKTTQPVVLRRLEQIMEDGSLPVHLSGEWRKVEPVDTWKTIVWINRDDFREDEFPLKRLFVNKFAVE